MGTDDDQAVRLLVVDDDPTVVALLTEFFDQQLPAWLVTGETDAERAVSLADGGTFDCIVSDYQMPVVSGLDLLAAARATAPHLPFFIYTALEREEVLDAVGAHRPTGIFRKRSGGGHYLRLVDRVAAAVADH